MANTFVYYDVESLSNVFTHCYWDPQQNKVYVYYLVDSLEDPRGYENEYGPLNWYPYLVERIKVRNPIFKGDVELHNLKNKDSFRLMVQQIGAYTSNHICNIKSDDFLSQIGRLVCDVDEEYDPAKHPFIVGYNSANYDTTMLAYFFYETQALSSPEEGFNIVTAAEIRKFNDQLFSDQFKKAMPSRLTYIQDAVSGKFKQNSYRNPLSNIRHNMLYSGRHIDASNLNESQPMVGLKRLLGMKGYQILESDKLGTNNSVIRNLDELLDLLAYNVSDVIYLEKLMQDPVYMSNFELKQELLRDYPELIYNQKPADKDGNQEYAPDIKSDNVRYNRLRPDSSSAQFAANILCPYGRLKDYETVSFLYPHKDVAEELGIEQVNVLDEARKFFYGKFKNPEVRAAFDEVYNYYKSIEGKNFNDSKHYIEDYGIQQPFGGKVLPEHLTPHVLNQIPKVNGNLMYYTKDEKFSTAFTKLSTGGTHGQEVNLFQYLSDKLDHLNEVKLFEKTKEIYPDPIELKKAKTIKLDGITYESKYFLKSGSTLKKSLYKEIGKNEPVLFKKKGNSKDTELNAKYTFTSVGIVNHEDFKSFYPNMLRRMKAFYNDGLGYDRYGVIYDQKEEFGDLTKAAKKEGNLELSRRYNTKRDGTKLVMNAASGAGDTAYDNSIRTNNKIISMRIIGQIFAWRIGQAQVYEGARIPSTNTDGLFTIMDETLNNKILDEQSKHINVDIEPEVIYFISKDSNNRVEFNNDDYENSHVEACGGGTVGCYFGPNIRKSLNHPAIIDWALVEYMKYTTMVQKDMDLEKPFQKELGLSILERAKDEFDKIKYLNMFQNVIASSHGSMNYIFAIDDENKPKIIQHYNRVFIMKDNTPGSYRLQAANARVITPAMKTKREAMGHARQAHDEMSLEVLAHHGIMVDDIPSNKDAICKKVTGIELDWSMFICNQDLNTLTEVQKDYLINNLDLNKYLELLDKTYTKNWKNDTSYKEKYSKEELLQLL